VINLPKEHLVDEDPLKFDDFKNLSLEEIVDIYKKKKEDLGLEEKEDLEIENEKDEE